MKRTTVTRRGSRGRGGEKWRKGMGIGRLVVHSAAFRDFQRGDGGISGIARTWNVGLFPIPQRSRLSFRVLYAPWFVVCKRGVSEGNNSDCRLTRLRSTHYC